MSGTARPPHQWFLGLLVVALLVEPIIAWGNQLSSLLGGCASGLRNPTLHGLLRGQHCVLLKGDLPVAKIPWLEDMWISGMLLFVLVCVLVALMLARWSKWSHRMPLIAVPALLFAGLGMAGRGFRRMEGEVGEFRISRRVVRRGGGFLRVDDGWMLNLPRRELWIPDIGGLALGLSFFAGLALLVLVSALLADYYRHRPLR